MRYTSLKCQCPLGLIPHCYKSNHILPSGRKELCQCPLGLIPHCYSRRRWPGRYAIRLPCQCPLGLIPHCYNKRIKYTDVRKALGVNALSGLYLIVTVPLQKPRFYAVSRACFCRYLSEYSDSNCFSCMLTIWTYLTRYTHL